MLRNINVYKLNTFINKCVHKQLINNYRLRTQIRSTNVCRPGIDDAPVSPDSAGWLKQYCELSVPHIDGIFLEHKDNHKSVTFF